VTASAGGVEDEFLAVAIAALRASDGAHALDSLGWWELLSGLGDGETRRAVFAFFRAQGRALSSSPALGGLLAQPFLEGASIAPGSLVATVVRHSPRRGPVRVVVGDVGGMQLLVDRPGHGAWVVDCDQVDLRRVDVAGRLVLHEVGLELSQWETTIRERDAREARDRSTQLGRLAVAQEILGAAEAAVEMAIEYAGNREQFGQRIGKFQAVRHLLAWARTDCVALEAVIADAVRLDGGTPERYDQVVKALAGRNGRRACERALQVLGGIGFTAELDHHHFHSRVLMLDALLGTSADLTRDLGGWLRSVGTDLRYPATSLLGEVR
jgi:Acyl-CoA dehydrogenase, C-terminal domain